MSRSRPETGGRAGHAPARAGREPQRGWAWGKAADKVFALQLAPLGRPWVNPRLKCAEEHQLKPDVIGAMGVVGPTWWPAVRGSHIASEEQLWASGRAYQHSAMRTSDGSCSVKGYGGTPTTVSCNTGISTNMGNPMCIP